MRNAAENTVFQGDLTPPHSEAAEQGLLGALMLAPEKIEDVSDFLRPEHFFHAIHGEIYGAILTQRAQGMTPTPVTLSRYFEGRPALAPVGGAGYLADLLAGVLSAVNAADYARQVFDCYLRREILGAARDTVQEAATYDLETGAEDILTAAEERLFNIGEKGSVSPGPCDLGEAGRAALAWIERAQRGEIRGVKSGIGALDAKNNGYMGGHLIIVAARPSMGKTAFALSAAHNAAQAGARGLFFSMEMSREELMQRLFARHTGIASGWQNRENGLSEERGEWRKLAESAQKLSALPLMIDESSGLSAAQIRSRAMRVKRRHGLDFIVVDYLGLMRLPDKYTSKVDQLGEVTRALKVLARDLDVPVILLHQLSRAVEGRDDKRPMLSDLRDSGNIEQDADVVQFIYREEYYLEREEPQRKEKDTDEKFAERMYAWQARLDQSKGTADIITAKWRQGKTGTARIRFNGPRQVFYDAEDGAEDGA